MTTISIEGVVLSRINFGEADRILTVFSREEGKVKILAKGSRKIKSKMAAHIEPFSVVRLFLVEGKTFYILAGAETLGQNESLLADLDVYKDACYACELLSMTLAEGVPNPKLYEVSKEVFLNLADYDQVHRELILRFFEYKLLESSGYVPNFQKCQGCGKELTEQDHYHGSFEGVLCQNCGPKDQTVPKIIVKILRLFAKNDLADVLNHKGIEKYNSGLKEVLLPFLYDILPRNPKAREL